MKFLIALTIALGTMAAAATPSIVSQGKAEAIGKPGKCPIKPGECK